MVSILSAGKYRALPCLFGKKDLSPHLSLDETDILEPLEQERQLVRVCFLHLIIPLLNTTVPLLSSLCSGSVVATASGHG